MCAYQIYFSARTIPHSIAICNFCVSKAARSCTLFVCSKLLKYKINVNDLTFNTLQIAALLLPLTAGFPSFMLPSLHGFLLALVIVPSSSSLVGNHFLVFLFSLMTASQ